MGLEGLSLSQAYSHQMLKLDSLPKSQVRRSYSTSSESTRGKFVSRFLDQHTSRPLIEGDAGTRRIIPSAKHSTTIGFGRPSA